MTDKAHVEFGEVILQTIMRGEGLRIVSAPEHTLISDRILNQSPDAPLYEPRMSVADGVVTLKASNRTVRYQLGDYRPFERCHEAHMLSDEPTA